MLLAKRERLNPLFFSFRQQQSFRVVVRHRLSIAKVLAEKRGVKVGLLRSFGINLPLPWSSVFIPKTLPPHFSTVVLDAIEKQ